MKQQLIYSILCFVGFCLNAQQEFHVFPKNDKNTPGREIGDGTIANPWDLKTALKQKPDAVNSGDIIWLHEGIYNGRFISALQSLDTNAYITVSAFEKDKVVLNGNVNSKLSAVLEVKSKQVIYKNFEITCLGGFSRNETDLNFELCVGLRHLTGENRFYNLQIHDNPGLGFGSWKHTAGSIIENCLIYNNGYIGKTEKGLGEGMYVQNKSEATRLIKNNIIFNNYYKGIEVWSASRNADFEYVKNITLEHNILFNNGLPSGFYRDNIIVASADRNGVNIAKNITLSNNVLYHNANFTTKEIRKEAPSLTIGFNKNAPVENVVIKNNIILGRSNTLRILHAKSLTFSNNTVYTEFIHFGLTTLANASHWKFSNNTYYVKNKRPAYRIVGHEDLEFNKWQTTFGIDNNSDSKLTTTFDLKAVLALNKQKENPNTFHLALFNKLGDDVTVDFKDQNLNIGNTYEIYDAENPNVIIKSGVLSEDLKIIFPMQLTAFKKPLHSTKAQKTISNFGVFIIEFETQNTDEVSVKKKDNAIKRFFRWLGF
ncbi:hypothetical protein A9Q86_12355 [Flavobacteriales bacterium 33_180_T64]|nr:hypothetical protein A9Q86_12355 [Flavobacteriales bacterium 33_180_T64]